MKVDTYKLLTECVSRGIESGWDKAHEVENPAETRVKDTIEREIMLQLCEYLIFES